jgi:ketosteroid isomerase-like protein
VTNPEIAVAFWRAMEARDWDGVRTLLADEFRAEWPQSGERFDRDGFIEVNRRYPGDWHLAVKTVIGDGAEVVSEIEVAIDSRVDRAISFFTMRGGGIVRLREFWPDAMDIPAWRQDLGLADE